MTKLLQKEAKFNWTSNCEAAFQQLKTLLTTAPVLTQPDITKPFDYWMCFDARRKGHCICLPPMEKTRRALCNPRLRASRCGSCSQDLVTLPLRQCLSYLYRPQEPQVHPYPIRIEYEAEKMVRVDQRL